MPPELSLKGWCPEHELEAEAVADQRGGFVEARHVARKQNAVGAPSAEEAIIDLRPVEVVWSVK